MLREEFITAASHHTTAEEAILLWEEVEVMANESGRHYHTIAHFESLLNELLPYKSAFKNWDVIIFSVAYHDSIYNPLKSNNEEKSAALAIKRLKAIGFPQLEVDRCAEIILATKRHESRDEETNLFTDADLSILGAAPEMYQVYTQQVRREYRMYPDFMYKPGRRKVLEHFLGMPRIYKSDQFYTVYEKQARLNLKMNLMH